LGRSMGILRNKVLLKKEENKSDGLNLFFPNARERKWTSYQLKRKGSWAYRKRHLNEESGRAEKGRQVATSGSSEGDPRNLQHRSRKASRYRAKGKRPTRKNRTRRRELVAFVARQGKKRELSDQNRTDLYGAERKITKRKD